jgi:hypothetical protein
MVEAAHRSATVPAASAPPSTSAIRGKQDGHGHDGDVADAQHAENVEGDGREVRDQPYEVEGQEPACGQPGPVPPRLDQVVRDGSEQYSCV